MKKTAILILVAIFLLTGGITVFSQTYNGRPTVMTNGAINISDMSATLSGMVNPGGYQTSYWFEYGTSQSLGNTTSFQSIGPGNGDFNVSNYISSLNYNQTYYFRLVAQNSVGNAYGSILSFSTNTNNNNNGGCAYGNCNYGSQPYVQTLNAYNNYSNNNYGNNNYVTFSGTVDPNGSDTSAWFEYGNSYDSLYSTTNSTYVGSGSFQQSFSQNTSGLLSNTAYYYRAVARNNYGTAYGQILSTSGYYYNNYNYNQGGGSPPQVITNSATYVSTASALLNGQVDDNNSTTNGWFEYGTTMNLGSQSTSQPMGTGNDYQNYSTALSGLSANTTYYFRVAAQNGYGTSYGSIQSFITTGNTNNVIYQSTNQKPQIIYVNENGTPYNPNYSNPGNGATSQQVSYSNTPYYGISNNMPQNQTANLSASALGSFNILSGNEIFGIVLVVILIFLIVTGFLRGAF